MKNDYADEDAEGLPLGLENTITTTDWGSGMLIVTVQHLVGEDDAGIKTADLASDVEAGGLESIGGVTDIEATFKIEVE